MSKEKPETRKRNPVPDPRGKMQILSISLLSLPGFGTGTEVSSVRSFCFTSNNSKKVM